MQQHLNLKILCGMPTTGGGEEAVLVRKPSNGTAEAAAELPDHDAQITSLHEDVGLQPKLSSFVKDSDQNFNPFGVLESAPSDLSKVTRSPATRSAEEHGEQEKVKVSKTQSTV